MSSKCIPTTSFFILSPHGLLLVPSEKMLPSIFLRILQTSFSPRFIHIGRLAFPVAFLIFIFYFTLSPHSTSPSPHSLSSFSLGLIPFSSSSRKSAFIDSISATGIDGPFDNSSLIELCASRKWVDGLIFKCEAHGGGIVEARNVVLNCLRFGIEAGGSSPSPLHPSPSPSHLTCSKKLIKSSNSN